MSIQVVRPISSGGKTPALVLLHVSPIGTVRGGTPQLMSVILTHGLRPLTS